VSEQELTDFVSNRMSNDYPNSTIHITIDNDFAALPHQKPTDKKQAEGDTPNNEE
jgi:hypothetical protein